jgi:hypothetical protein
LIIEKAIQEDWNDLSMEENASGRIILWEDELQSSILGRPGSPEPSLMAA